MGVWVAFPYMDRDAGADQEAIAAMIAAGREHPHAQDTRPARRKSVLGHESTETEIRLYSHRHPHLHSVTTRNPRIENSRHGTHLM